MAEVVGTLILSAIGATSIPGIAGLGTLATTTIAGFSLATVVGTAAIVGVSIGLQYAFKPPVPGLPKPEDGSQAVKQAIPPRIRGYGVNRLAGYYMGYEAAGAPPANSYDILAFHSGRIGRILTLFLHDDIVTTTPSIQFGGSAVVDNNYPDGRYGNGLVAVEARLGANSQVSSVLMSELTGIWTANHRGNGIAWLAMKCYGQDQVPIYTQTFPHQLPVPSVAAECSPVWDPRDPGQHRDDESTWLVSFNPVIQLIDYLTRADGGMGFDYESVIEPNIVAWLAEADLCDVLVDTAEGGQEVRYQSSGWFQFDNKPEDVIGGILSTCDGWLSEAGDGTLSIVVGVYREPTDPPLTEAHIIGFNLSYGQADEQMVNQIVINYTDPSQKYVSVQPDPWRDEESISETGVVRSQQIDLKWVQSASQARRLADRAMQRLNPAMTGAFTTSLYGLRYAGKRWVPIRYPFVSGLQDSVVEIQNMDIDLLRGRIDWTFNLIGDDIEAYDPNEDEGTAPPVPPPVDTPPSLDFSQEANSQYLILLEDI